MNINKTYEGSENLGRLRKFMKVRKPMKDKMKVKKTDKDEES